MLYSKFIYHAKEMTIMQLETGEWYLEPEWKDIICREIEKDLDKVEDSYLTDWWDVENVLELEVKRRNARESKTKDVIDWLYDIITQTVEPAMLAEETDLFKNVVEYLKTSHQADKQDVQEGDNIIPFPTNKG